MKKGLTALIPALVLAISLTACGGREDGGKADENTGTDNSVVTGDTGTSAGEMSRYVGPNAAGGSTGFDMNGAYSGQNPQRAAPDGVETNPYLRDGQYRAYDSGKVEGRDSSQTRDLTRDARDMMKDAGDALMDMGRDARNALGDLGSDVKNGINGQ